MRRKSLSVALVNFNHGHFLPRALTAITSQSRLPDELVLVDDASTDNSVEVMQEFAARHAYIKIVRNPKNIGAYAGLNGVMNQLCGDYMHWHASDDYMLPGFIETLMSMAEQYDGAGIVSAGLAVAEEKEDDGWGMDTAPRLNPAAKIELLPECDTGFYAPGMYRAFLDHTSLSPMHSLAPSTIFRTAIVRQLGDWPGDLGIYGVSLILQACALRGGMAYVNMPLYTWIWRKVGMTRTELADLVHMAAILKKQSERMLEPPFDSLFTDRFRSRWIESSEEMLRNLAPPPPVPPQPVPSLPPVPPPSMLKRMLAVLTPH